MELIKDKRCYTDMCLDGRWFHHDHCTPTVYMLRGGEPVSFSLDTVPETEDELFHLLIGLFK